MRAHARRRVRNLTARAFAVPVGKALSTAAQTLAGAAPSTIAMTVAAVKACARLSGQPSPAGEKTGRVLADIRRERCGAILYVGEPTMRRIAAWRVAAGLDDGPLFRRIRRGDRVEASAITDRAARSIIRARAADGIAPRCPRTTLAASSPRGAPSPASATARVRATPERWGRPRCRSGGEARRRRRTTYPGPPAPLPRLGERRAAINGLGWPGRPACDPGASMPRPRPRWSAPRPAPPCLRSAHTTAQDFEHGMDKSG